MALTGTLLADFSAFIKEAAAATTAAVGLGQSGDAAAAQLNKLAGADTVAGIKNVATEVAKVPAPVNESASAFSGLSTQIAATFTGMVSSEAVIGAVSTGFQALTGFVEASVAAFSKQEDASAKLVASLRQHGLATPEVINQYNALATAFQNTTKYADEDIQSMESLLTLVGDVMPSQMQAALKASTDLASGLGIDLEKATMLVAKAAAGHTEQLGRYGITVDAADVKTRGLTAVLDVINEKFGGQAAAAIETYSGRVAQAANAWDNVKEALGKVILEDPLVTSALNHMVAATKSADAAASEARPTLAGLAADFGLIDRNTAVVIDGFEAYVDGLNTVAQAYRMIDAVPSPFEKIAQSMALPAINGGLELNAKLLKEHEEQVKKDAKALEEWQTATTNIAAAQASWQTTLDTLDGAVAEAIKWDLSMGASQADVAKSYGVTRQQVDAVKISLEEYASVLNSTADFEKAAAARRLEISHQMTQAVNDQIVATLKKKQADDAANEAFLAAALKDAQAQDAMQQGVMTTADTTTRAADTIGSSFEQGFARSAAAFEQFKGVTVAGTREMTDAVATFGMAEAQASGNYAEMQAAMRQAQFEHGGFYVGLQTGAPPVMQTRDSGGPVVAGQSYLIGGGKAPEIFTPGASGFVTPGGTGGGGGVTIHNTFNITQPLGTPEAIARVVADAQVALMKGQGVRLPYGT